MIVSNFVPRPWRPFESPATLFGVAHPQAPGYDPPSDSDREWFHLLRWTTAAAIQVTVAGVHHNYTKHGGVSLCGQRLGRLLALYDVISLGLLGGEPSATRVGDDIQRTVKTFGLVMYTPEPGPRHNWPAAHRPITMDEAIEVADAAFLGRWPASPPPGTRLDEHDPFATLDIPS